MMLYNIIRPPRRALDLLQSAEPPQRCARRKPCSIWGFDYNFTKCKVRTNHCLFQSDIARGMKFKVVV